MSVNYQHQLNTQLLNMSNSSQDSDVDGKMDNKAKDTGGASPPGVHDSMECDGQGKIDASVHGVSTVRQGCSGKSPPRECEMDSDSSVHTLDLAAFCESELSCSCWWLLHS